jgi:cholesterol 25-hydroxylase
MDCSDNSSGGGGGGGHMKRVWIPCWQIWLARGCYLAAILAGYVYYDWLQQLVNLIWSYLLRTWLFNSVYFETVWTACVYPPILVSAAAMERVAWLRRYKLHPASTVPQSRWRDVLLEAVTYMAPLLLLDTVMVKRYTGVGIDPAEWSARAAHWIQSTRALPSLPPTVLQMCAHLTLSFVLYDLLFFAVHYSVHRSATLYRRVHAHHHAHAHVHAKVTNQLHVLERIVLVLSANFALRLVHAHPLTRTLFVPLFLAAITDNHSGYDLPWTLDKVVPGGVVGGSAAHFAHHQHGDRHYQPFLTYIDTFLARAHKHKH